MLNQVSKVAPKQSCVGVSVVGKSVGLVVGAPVLGDNDGVVVVGTLDGADELGAKEGLAVVGRVVGDAVVGAEEG
jgi:hypothetical protein